MITFQNNDRTITIDKLLEFLNGKFIERDKAEFPSLCNNDAGYYEKLVAEAGKKYIKLIKVDHRGDNRSVYCFLDMQGNIFKAATWKAPAKHIRGNIFDENYGWGKSLTRYGAAYLR